MPANRTKSGQFAPGTSGNPRGRPKTDEQIKKALMAVGKEAVDRLVEIMRDPDVPAKTRLSAINSILDRAYGKPAQHIDAEVGADTNVSISIADEILKFIN